MYYQKVIYRQNSEGRPVKVTQTFKRVTRRKMDRFGDAADGNRRVTMVSKEAVHLVAADDHAKMGTVCPPSTASQTATAWVPTQRNRCEATAPAEDAPPAEEVRKNVYRPPHRSGGTHHRSNKFSVKVSNIDETVTPKEFEDIMYCDIRLQPTRIKLVMNRGEHRHLSRGYAFLDFQSADGQQAAIDAIDGHVVNYQVLSAEVALPQTPR